ncbi:MAG TPA: hypothetical protein VGQ76_07235 [Thermoanaerobaculia bacterium]|jgi:hypothetical protein|nr:hypothetical protein [Thermoanaerobaculia bacterium]
MKGLLLFVMLLLAGCSSPVERATKLTARGDAKAAETLLRDQLSAQPDDLHARVMLGRLLLRRNAIADADQLFAELNDNVQIAASYREAMHAQEDEKAIAALAYRAVRRSRESAAATVCKELLTIADTRRTAGVPHEELLAIAGALEPCAPTILEPLRKWITHMSAKEALAFVGESPYFTAEQAREIAITLRDEAARIAGKQDARALALLDVVARVSPAISGDLDVVVLRSRLSSAVGRSSTPSASSVWLFQIYRDGTPKEITLRVMRLVGQALDVYKADMNRYPLAYDFFALRGSLTPRYLSELPMTDGWGRPLVYTVGWNGVSASVVSRGAPGTGSDIVWENGQILQADSR